MMLCSTNDGFNTPARDKAAAGGAAARVAGTERPTMRDKADTARHGTAQHDTAKQSTARHSTAQHGTAKQSTARHSTAQHGTTKRSTKQHGT